MRTNFFGGAYTLRSHPLAAQTCINLYLEPNESGNGDPAGFYGTPGLVQVNDFAATRGCRGLHVTNGTLWAVYNSTVYRLDASLGAVPIGTIPNSSGPVEMADNGTHLVVAHQGGWHAVTLATNAFAEVADAPTMADVCFIDNYFVGANQNGTYQWANLNSTTVDALNFASAEGSPDNTVRTLADHRELWLFGTQSVEVAVVTTDPDLPFTRTSYIEQGILAPKSAAKEDNSVFWLGKNESGHGVVYRAQGYIPTRISTFAIEQVIATYARPDLATAYTYQQDGHHFYVLSFDEATWAYDINTGLWAQRAYRNTTTGALGRHRGQAHAFFRGRHILGDYEDGRLYELSPDAYTDDGDAIYRERTWPQFDSENRWVTYHRAELIADMGVGLGGAEDEAGTNPRVWLQWSDDGGRNWSSAQDRYLGRIGEFLNRCIWRRLGKARTRYFKLWTAEPVRIAWRGFNINVTG
jgi:hypothetical protein